MQKSPRTVSAGVRERARNCNCYEENSTSTREAIKTMIGADTPLTAGPSGAGWVHVASHGTPPGHA